MHRAARIWVAGGRTLLGAALVERLRAAGYGQLVGLPPHEPDLTDAEQVERFFAAEGPEYVFVAAGKSGGIRANQARPAELMRDNLLVAANVLDSAWRHGARKLLYLASSCAYPRLAPQPLREEALLTGPLEPTSEPYALAKLAGTVLCRSYRQQYGANFISAVPANAFGPHDDFGPESGHVIPSLIRRLHEAQRRGDAEVPVWGSGTARREFVYAPDLADACRFAMEHYDDAAPINLGGGVERSIAEVAPAIAEVVGYRGRLRFDTDRPDGAPRKALDSSRLRALGWRSRCDFRAALEATYDWYLHHMAGETLAPLAPPGVGVRGARILCTILCTILCMILCTILCMTPTPAAKNHPFPPKGRGGKKAPACWGLVPMHERLYRSVYRIRRVEEEIARVYPSDRIKSPVHLSIGQEAVSVGVCEALGPEDVVFGTYRGHALYLAKGGDLKQMLAELYGKATGCARGKGGSMHLIDPAAGVMGTSAVVGTTIANAVGYAYALRHRGSSALVASFFGDGATEEGVFAESLNFAALKRLPVLFVCENNQYAIHTHQGRRQGRPDICEKARAFGLPAERVEGNDILRLYEWVQAVTPAVRSGAGPYFIEVMTYRWREHVGPCSDFHLGYRAKAEAQPWIEADQLRRLAELLDADTCARIEAEVEEEIGEAFAFADLSPWPEPAELYADVFKEE